MKALRCDRCKKYYVFYESRYVINGKKTSRFNSVGIDFKAETGVINPQNEGIEYDLCESCLNKLIKFLEKDNAEKIIDLKKR